jgi:hypothetical protein
MPAPPGHQVFYGNRRRQIDLASASTARHEALPPLLYPPITREAFERCRHDGATHRICFARTHRDQPRHTDKYAGVGFLALPFAHGIADLLKVGCRFQQPPRFNENGSPWWRIGSKEEFRTIQAWACAQGTRV